MALCITAATVGPGRAASPRAFGLGDVLTLRDPGGLAWSPDGSWLAFTVNEPDTAANGSSLDIWIADFAGGPPRRLTTHPGADYSPTFSPGGDTIAFIGNRETGPAARSSIYMMSLTGGEPWRFGSYEEGIGEVTWSPDGRWLAFVMNDTLPGRVRAWRAAGRNAVVEDEPVPMPQLWVVEVATGARRRLTDGTSHVWYARWSPDSRAIAFLTRPTGRPEDAALTDIGVVRPAGGPVRKLGVIGDAFTWSPDSRWVALATSPDRDIAVEKGDVWAVPVAGGVPVNLTQGYEGDVGQPCWNTTSDTLFFHSARGASCALAAVALRAAGARGGGPGAAEGGAAPSPVTILQERIGEAGAPLAAADGHIAWIESRPEAPAEIRVAARAGADDRALTAFNAGVARLRLGTTRTVRWKSSDGVTVEGVLVRPPGAAPHAALKTLVMLHGGPYGERFGAAFEPKAQFFACRGYQVFMPNYRGSGGYGRRFLVRERADWGGQDWRDIESGVDSLIARGFADGQRLGIFGRSYGGYLTAWAITQTRRYDAACVFAGAVDLPALYGQSDVQRGRELEFEGTPWDVPDRWRAASPITHIASARTPTLILFGENDRRVPLAQGLELYRALERLKVPTELVRYPGAGHHLRSPAHVGDQLTRMADWFDRWVR